MVCISASCISFDSYIKPQLILIWKSIVLGCISFDSYIKPQPIADYALSRWRCISFDSYIKPQLYLLQYYLISVVYLLIPTSNHNVLVLVIFPAFVVYLLIPTSNHNPWFTRNLGFTLYIFWFLHQTTTASLIVPDISSCISFDSYIKPQHINQIFTWTSVVYLLIPTSNHNETSQQLVTKSVVYLLIPTSNHNSDNIHLISIVLYIFWFLHQTTTQFPQFVVGTKLYIFWFLHQTTTARAEKLFPYSCISFDSYIKPQLFARSWTFVHGCISFDSYIKPQLIRVRRFHHSVVYLLIPTSNHNIGNFLKLLNRLYIFWFLHQTTTTLSAPPRSLELYIFWFLHQTTTWCCSRWCSWCCISFDSYIKPQLTICIS